MTDSEAKPLSVISALAIQHGMEKEHFVAALKATVVPTGISDAQFAAFCMVAKQYNLNPLTKEIYAFPAKGGGIVPIVSIDGWCNIINSNPALDGIQFVDNVVDGKLLSITCRISRKDRSQPIECVEYMEECKGTSEPWRRWPARMLRHKALIQCARYAFSFSGIYDQDEAERMDMVDVTPQVVDPQTGEMVRAGSSPFKNAAARKQFCATVRDAIAKADSLEQLKTIIELNAPTLNKMKLSESEHDHLGADDINLANEMAVVAIEQAERLNYAADRGNFDGGDNE